MSTAATTATGVVEADSVSFAYGDHLAVDDVSFALAAGEFAALVGPNGSGKSTLVRLLLGLLRPDTGSVRLLGEDPAELTERGRLGYVPQRGVLAPDLPVTVAEVVATGRLARRAWWRPATGSDREAITHAIESVGLGDLGRRPVLELSGGQQQRVLIARALASDPELLVLDEPIAGVDAESQALFRDSLVHLVCEHGASVLLVSHELGAVADDLDRVLVMKRTLVFDGTPAALTARGVSLGVHAEDLPLWLERIE